MKNANKILFAVLVLMILVGMITPMSSVKAEDEEESQLLHSTYWIPGEKPERTHLDLTAQAGEDEDPFFSWDPNTHVVFTGLADDTPELYRSFGTSTFTRLTYTSAEEIHPDFNRGCTEIVYAVEIAADSGNSYDIKVISANGGVPRLLTDNNTDDVNPRWSPDGKKIAFESYRNGQGEIYVMNKDGSGQVRLTNNSAYDGQPTWSPDGTMIAFISKRSGGYRVWKMNANGSNPVQVSTRAWSTTPRWSPSGRYIAFSADNDGNGWLDTWIMNQDGTGARQLTQGSNTGVYGADTEVTGWYPGEDYILIDLFNWTLYDNQWYITASSMRRLPKTGSASQALPTTYAEFYADWETVDITPMNTHVFSLPAISPTRFSVRWSEWEMTPPGFQFDVQYRDGNSGWIDWFTWDGNVSANFDGQPGHTYYFRVRGIDPYFNIEAWPPTYDTFTTVDGTPPQSAVSPLPSLQPLQAFLIFWNGADFSGIATYDIQLRADQGEWANWLTNTTKKSALFQGVSGVTYDFRSRATDNSGNVEDYPPEPDATTLMYGFALQGKITDNTGTFIDEYDFDVQPIAISKTNSLGIFETLVAGNHPYTAQWSKTEYAGLPPVRYDGFDFYNEQVILPPANNLVVDMGFEENDQAWQTNGTPIPVIASGYQHSGAAGALLGSPISPYQASGSLITDSNGYLFEDAVLDQQGNLHLILSQQDLYSSRLVHLMRNSAGTWSQQAAITPYYDEARDANFVIDEQGNLHLVFIEEPASPENAQYVSYLKRTNGQWSNPVRLSVNQDAEHPSIAVGDDGNTHVLWYVDHQPYGYIYRMRAKGSSTWSEPKLLPAAYIDWYERNSIQVDSQNLPYFSLCHADGLAYAYMLANRNWAIEIIYPGTDACSGRYNKIIKDYDNRAFSVYSDNDANFYIRERLGNNLWSPARIASMNSSFSEVQSDASNNIHFLCCARYQTRYESGIWSDTKLLFPGVTEFSLQELDYLVDEDGTVQILCRSGTTLYYARRATQGWWYPNWIEPASNWWGARIFSNNDSMRPSILGWYTDSGYIFDTKNPVVNSTDDASTIKQTLTIPGDMTAPALSFLYQLDHGNASTGAGLVVSIDKGTLKEDILTITEDSHGWEHAWIDLTAYAGQTISLEFSARQINGEKPTLALLDEVSVGTAYPDLWVDIDAPPSVQPGETVDLQLIYSNQGGGDAQDVVLTLSLPDGVTYSTAMIPPDEITGPTLTWNIPSVASRSSNFTITITVVVDDSIDWLNELVSSAVISSTTPEGETYNNDTLETMLVGWVHFLPMLSK